ncbi:coagulation factor IIIb [Trichomycterus rosablanca]|uniref:coagulation factor IIIb n=1 Tax=Trichomycterus rosablanca TaxID=2290929 RepID=UPI002F35B6D7
MKEMRKIFTLFFIFSSVSGGDSIPQAQNLSWSSFNFKTLLTWNPKPINYSYTVEFSRVGKDRQRNPHCIQISSTECDLTYDLNNLKSVYTADVLSEPLTSDLIELPSSQSKRFCPYNDTVIGRPEFRMKVDENQTLTLFIDDQITALYRDGRLLTIRDIFNQDLKYKIIYNRAGSTGTKELVVSSSEVQMVDLDLNEGHSYCFSMAVFIPSRRGTKRLSRWSSRRCSPSHTTGTINEYGLIVMGVALLLAVTVLMVTVLSCCRLRRRQKDSEEQSDAMTQV